MPSFMRQLLLLLVSLLTFSASAQIHVQKRKHLKGYSIQSTNHPKKEKDFVIKKVERITSTSEEKTVSTEPAVVRLPVIESASLEFSQVHTTLISSKLSSVKPVKKIKLLKQFIPSGAGLILSANSVNSIKKTPTILEDPEPATSPVFAYIGIGLTILTTVALILYASSIIGAGTVFIIGVPALIAALVGLDSSQKTLSIISASVVGLMLPIALGGYIIQENFTSGIER